MASSRLTITSDTMITLMLLLVVLHTRLPAINGHEEVENNYLLSKLGITRRTEVGKSMMIPSSTMELYKSMLGESKAMTTHFSLPGLHTKSANTARIYSNQGPAPIKSKAKKYRLQFDINSIPENHQVKAAEVRLPMKYDQALGNEESIYVILHDIVQPGEKGLSKPILRLIDSKSINTSTISTTASFDVTPYIERLSKNNFKDNHGILVQCVTESGSQTHLLSLFDFVTPEKTLLLVYTDDGTSEKSSLEQIMRRRKRSVSGPVKPRKKGKRESCRRYSMRVNFNEIGFGGWIAAPPVYDAFYCHGDCSFPLANHMNASNHAAMQMRLYAMNLANIPEVCCVPTVLQAQSLIYRDDEGGIQMKNFSEMTVAECGCR